MTTSSEIEVGPVDLIVIGYPKDSPLSGEAAAEVIDLVARGIIRVLDALFVIKEQDGSFSGLVASDLSQEQFGGLAVFEGASSGMLGDEDAAEVAAAMEPGEAALVMVYENTWAAPFVAAVRRNGGELIASRRIPATDLMDAIEAIAVDEDGS